MKKNIAILTAVLLAAAAAFAKSPAKKGGSMNLSERKQSVSAVAALSAKGDLAKLKGEVDLALERGLSVNDIGEIFLQLYAYAGFPRCLNAQGVLAQVVKEREAAGKNVIYGTAPAAVPSENRYAHGLAAINKIFNQNGTQERPQTTGYAETTDVFLKEHLFSDIIGRNNMSTEERELATASMLAGIGNVNPQLAAHITGALNSGNSADEMRDAFALLSQTAGKAESKNALSVLDAVLNQTASPASSASPAQAENNAPYPPQAKVSAFPVGEPNDAFAAYFTGKSWLAFLSRVPVSQDGALNLSIANVTFEPGCRNNWHIHHAESGGGQILICVGGRGWYQEEGRSAQALKPGDVVTIPANVKHWHGAAADSWFAHLAVEVPGTNAANEWLEPVTDSVYDKLK
ncbi:MAG: carboxymuconolactone decarboxylase family protein [Bacteroides sp.]|nr:carboxymuconolactone decarboxylase family protein [Prevotella sp.]MCM1408890.1 carboxymuconolactone decarboxylase family protein [Treponema brennaborense]MCM1470849.1 carboxymuconolactone decarboxylase family protein [Bacteroides sp.]